MIPVALPPWARVAFAWCSTPGRTGTTLPYLFGATRTPIGAILASEDEIEYEFFALLNSMRHGAGEGFSCCIRHCGVIKQPVVVVERVSPPAQFGAWADLIEDQPPLRIQLSSLSQEEALTFIWNESRDAVTHGRYSHTPNGFRAFEPNDLLEIESALRTEL